MSITLTHEHHHKVQAAANRLLLSRSDLIGLLIDAYAEALTPDDVEHARIEHREE